MTCFGYKQSNVDHTIFVKCKDAQVAVLVVYVDDMVLTEDNVKEIQLLKANLAKKFEIKALAI